MRGYAIGDTHLRASERREALRRRALDQILADATRERPDFIVWPGDLFDKTSTVVDRKTLQHYVKAFGAICPIVACRGNHDAVGDVDLFADLRTAFPMTFVTRPSVVPLVCGAATLAVAAMPWPEEAGLVALGIAPPDVPDVAAAALEAIFMSLAGDLSDARARGWAPLFIGHANVLGARASTGQPLAGHDIALRPEHLDRFGADVPKILNHIHAAQDVHGATYVGSIAPQDWGECEGKRYLVLDWDGVAWTIESRPLDLPHLYHVEGVLSRSGFEWVVKRGPDGDIVTTPASWKGHEVRVRYRFQASESALLAQAEAAILAEFAEAAHLEIEPVAVPDRAVRAPEVAAAKTTAAKLQAYCALSGVDVSDGVLAKLAALETREAAEVLAQLEQRLQAIAAVERAVAA